MRLHAVLSVVVVVTGVLSGSSAEPSRLPWTGSRIHGSPDPAKPYAPEPAFPGLPLDQGLEMVAHAGRFFVVERGGRIVSFSEKGASEVDLFADLKTGRENFTFAYGLAFHPRSAENRTVFLTYTIGNDLDDGTRLSRFRFSETDPPKLLPETEEVLLTWRSGGHNGAHLQFGPDKMLYISTGDATAPSPPDGLKTGQDNSDLLSAILRIDVDAKDSGLAYRIPPDNPWVGKEGVRPEIWAFGFRNPWKISFNADGRLWVGDVGWELWEMIHLVGKGGNHGWSAMEASQPILPGTASPLAPITPPVAAHPHSEAASITGGYVYRGARLPELRGAYVYADYETGKIWALWHDGTRTTRHEEIADTPHKIASFGVGSDGELHYLHYGEPTTVFRLTKHPRSGQPSDFPKRLSETGLFRDTAAALPADGVYEYTVAEPMWEDGATATRWIALPDNSTIETTLANRRYTATWPKDAVLARTVRLGKHPVETQVLHFDGETWNGYSYRWNADATDAELVGAGGAEIEVPAGDGKGGPHYRIASRAECMRCHTAWNEYVNGFQPVQLAGFPAFPDRPARETAASLGLADPLYFERDPGGRLVASRGSGQLETRARSWLHANCAHCHRRHGGGSAPLEVNFDRALSETALLWQSPTRGDFGLEGAHAVTPGEPWRSVLNYRVSSIGSGHMPPLGSREVDPHGAKILWDWVAAMPRETPVEAGSVASFDETSLTNASSAMRLAHALATGTIAEPDRADAIKAGLASEKLEVRALFERFRPPSERPRARSHDPPAILSLKGDPDKGAKLLSPSGKLAACFACHRLGGTGVDFGPGLDGVGSRLEPGAILESLLAPSRTIAPEYRLWSLELKSGGSLAGFIPARDADGFTLRSGPGQERRVANGEVKRTLTQDFSAMPEGLVDGLDPQELADLLAWLVANKGG